MDARTGSGRKPANLVGVRVPTRPAPDAVTVVNTTPTRPALKSALRRVWRDPGTLQFGIDPTRAVVISGLGVGAARLVESLDGTHDLPGVAQVARRLGIGAGELSHLLDLLARAGVLEDAATDHRALAALSPVERDMIAPDIAAAALVQSGPDAGVGAISRRRARVLSVTGAGRVGASVVTLLAAAGIGTVLVDDAASSTPADTSPGGLCLDDVGARRQDAAARAARRVAPSVHTTLPSSRRTPDLTVLTGGPTSDPAHPVRLVRGGVPHLYARVREATGIVGPLVLPGRSSCQRCHDLHRCDRDPAWPQIAAQLMTARSRGNAGGACDTVLAAAVAAHAVLQVLAYLDGNPAPPTVDGTLEISQADGSVRRRSWSVHPSCGCTWPAPPGDPE